MATIDRTILTDKDVANGVLRFAVRNLSAGETSDTVDVSGFNDIQIQFELVSGSGSTATANGRLYGGTYAALQDTTETNITATGDSQIIQVIAPPDEISFSSASGTGVFNIFVKCLKRRT